MSESICKKCKNLFKTKRFNGNTSPRCIYGHDIIYDVEECSHFEEKPKDISKPLTSARLSTSCEQPSNHKRIGKMPRKQPKKKEEHQDDDHCDCGGILNYTERDKEDVMIFKCEDCGKEHYNERDL